MAELKEKLFSEFAPVSTEEWMAKITADLKGVPFEKKLVWKTGEGFNVNPFYRAEDIEGLKTTESLPGEFPYVRGTKKDNDWKVRQNIEVTCFKEANEKALDLLKIFHLEEEAHEVAKNLPYGKQRRLEIARALATEPKLLLLDEPAAGMNPQETKELMEMIRWIRKEFNLSILLIEHDMGLVMGVCERIYVLEYGMKIAEGTPEEIKQNARVIEAYLGEEVIN